MVVIALMEVLALLVNVKIVIVKMIV